MPSPLSAVFLSMVTSMLAANEVDLIWEEAITDVKSYADRLLAEADGLFGSAASDWDVVGDYDHGLRVYSRPIKGSKVIAIHRAYIFLHIIRCHAIWTTRQYHDQAQ